MKNSEITIIGGGVIGASVAYHLTEMGANDVLILEREAEQGKGSTGKATGGVRAQFETEINIKMSLYSIGFFTKFNELIGVDCGYEPRGYLFFATEENQFDYLKKNVEKQKSLGVKGVKIVDTKTISEIAKGLNCEDIIGGSFGANDGFINSLGVMEGFTEKSKENGAKILMETEVFSIETANSKVKFVETNRGKIETKTVVICAGAWARDLVKTTGIDLPVEPLKRQIVWAKSEKNLPENLPMVIDLGSGFHFRPVRDSKTEVLFAYPEADEKPSFNTDFDESFIEKIYKRAKYRAPFLAETNVVREKCRAGLYENTPDHHAILGGCAIEGLYFASGFSGHGVMHSPATGRALAEIILEGKANFLDVSCLSLERFTKGKLLHETAFI
ncbi:MAG: FAD-binding oxidoreductase [Acidobacteria bacterium]|nr:FAD-binding oxidoreductase [Acidobacteriota bacterium]MCA1638711.1 FAD-binding oxidoreductase [Acidobacteriota bacterium]